MKLLEFADLDEYATNMENATYDPASSPTSMSYKRLGEMQREEHHRRQSSSSHK